ncbi:uncharacterized protein [Lepeophtheirus salmonis]|uniref:uncharacterized protein n=1 Tax=Lepeophtheirus salmonis TaxID=72036 RepID=UPI001AE51F2D|nr:glyceraldehyde-3-phosphate dehydrogenase-like [Lepeophtheirus salmonis]
MADLTIGINGFGRIGKICFTLCIQNNLNVTKINSPNKTVDDFLYSLKYDTVFKTLLKAEKIDDSSIKVFSETKKCVISLLNNENPEDVDWNTDFLLECSGKFKNVDGLKNVNSKFIILSYPSPDIDMFVFGVNHKEIKKNTKIISNASCTTNCLGPITKILHDNFVIEEGLMKTVHSVTSSQPVVDKTKNSRRMRSILNNIIPTTTGAAKAVTKIIPELKNKLTGIAFRVPVLDSSVVDLTVKIKKPTTLEEIRQKIEEQADPHILGITTENVVSSDFIGDQRSSIFDLNASIMLNDKFFKIICWYDNEYGYSNRMIDLLKYSAKINELLL